MNIQNNRLDFFSKHNKFVLTTRFPYELEAVITNVSVIAIITDWRIAAKFKDVLTEHIRIKQMDATIPDIDDLTFLMVKDEANALEYIIADAYIEDLYVL